MSTGTSVDPKKVNYVIDSRAFQTMPLSRLLLEEALQKRRKMGSKP